MMLASESDDFPRPFLVPGSPSVREHYLNKLLYSAAINPQDKGQGTYPFSSDLNVAWYYYYYYSKILLIICC
jgi:hypothetical protein